MTFEGEIGDIDVVKTFLELAHGRFTGAARFESDDLIKIVYLRDGQFLSASTNDRADTLDEILLRSSIASRDHIRQALARRKDGESLGDALLNLGFITRRELVKARRVQLVGILRSLQGWSNGTYQLVSDYVPKREEGTSFPVAQIVVELLVTSEDRSAVEAAMEGGERRLRSVPGGQELFDTLGLNEDAETVLGLVDGQRSASEIAAATVLDAFSVYKLLHAFETVGVLEPLEIDPTAVGSPVDDDLDWGTPSALPVAPAVSEPEVLELEEETRGPVTEQLSVHAASAEYPEPEESLQPAPGPGSASVPYGSEPFRRSTSHRRKKGSRVLMILLLAVVLLGGAAAAWWYLGRQASEPNELAAIETPAAGSIETETVVPDTAFAAEAPLVGDRGASESVSTSVDAVPATPPAPEPVTINAPAESTPSDVAWSWQVAFVCQESSLAGARAAGGAEVWTMPVERDGRSCYRVFWGRFESRSAAQSARSAVPAYFGDAPIVVSPRSMGR